MTDRGKVVKCARCKGKGTIPHPIGGTPQTCPACNGSGVQRV